MSLDSNPCTKINNNDTFQSPHLERPALYLLDTPSLNFPDTTTARRVLREYFINTFDTYTCLFECLKNDNAYFVKPIALRHPLIFYFGHTATFFINKLLLAKLIRERINPIFENMFAVGVDEMSWDDLNEQHYDWPSVSAVRKYRQQVRDQVLQIIDHAPLELPLNWENPWWSIIMGIEHERIHLETSSVLIRQHKLEYVHNHPLWRAHVLTGIAPDNRLIPVPAGQVHFNKKFDDAFYGWDNEYGEHQADIDVFQASQYLVSNQEFLGFVENKGYHTEHYWSEEGWAWRNFAEAEHPTFWHWQDHQWQLRTMLERIPMPWDWPVEVNYHEAKAFCQWKSEQMGVSIRLPTEDEWYRLYDLSGLSDAHNDKNANIALKYANE